MEFIKLSEGISHKSHSELNMLDPFLVSFPPSDSSPFSSPSFWFHEIDPSPSLPKHGGLYPNPDTNAGKAQVPEKISDIAPAESQVFCWSWKSTRFLVSRWSISSLKQPRAASAR